MDLKYTAKRLDGKGDIYGKLIPDGNNGAWIIHCGIPYCVDTDTLKKVTDGGEAN